MNTRAHAKLQSRYGGILLSRFEYTPFSYRKQFSDHLTAAWTYSS